MRLDLIVMFSVVKILRLWNPCVTKDLSDTRHTKVEDLGETVTKTRVYIVMYIYVWVYIPFVSYLSSMEYYCTPNVNKKVSDSSSLSFILLMCRDTYTKNRRFLQCSESRRPLEGIR